MTGVTRPIFEKLHVGCPNLGDRDRLMARIGDVFDRRWLTNDGPYLQAFEQEIASYLGVRNCVAVTNATLGLQIAIRALGLSGEVIVPSFTFPATAHALAWEGVTPIFCDVDPGTHNMDPAAVERLLGPRTTGILAVHVWGNACDVDALAEIADRRGLQLLYDAAHAFGCSHRGRMIGNFGAAEVFSFHATKFVSAGEGGAITTNDDELAKRLRRLRNFGIDGDEIAEVGINGKMSELAAVMGLTSLESRQEFVRCNRENQAAYAEALADVSGLRLLGMPTGEEHNQQYVVVEVEPGEAGLSRDQIVSALHAENVLAKRYFFPGCHRMAPYRAAYDSTRAPLPHTERLCDRLVQLPNGSAVSGDDIWRIGELLRGLTARIRRAA